MKIFIFHVLFDFINTFITQLLSYNTIFSLVAMGFGVGSYIGSLFGTNLERFFFFFFFFSSFPHLLILSLLIILFFNSSGLEQGTQYFIIVCVTTSAAVVLIILIISLIMYQKDLLVK